MAQNKMTIKVQGAKDFARAIEKNPRNTLKELQKFFIRAKAKYQKTIINDPWGVGERGGGSPVDTGALRDSHISGSKVRPYSLIVSPDERVAPYAKYVHGEKGEINSRTGVRARPWLTYAFNKEEKEVRDLADKMLLNIVKKLSH